MTAFAKQISSDPQSVAGAASPDPKAAAAERDDDRAGPLEVLLWAAWFGILTGFGEAALWGVKKLYLGRPVRYGPHLAWTAPAADAILFLIPGVALAAAAAAAWTGRRGLPRATTILVFAFLGFFSLLLMYTPLHVSAQLLLSAGLAVQSARLAGKWPQLAVKVMRRSMPLLVLAVVGTGIGVAIARDRQEARAMAALPAAPSGAPNVLLITLDTVRASSLSLYGYQRPTTPKLSEWAKRGTVFDRAISTSPWTLPSHASMMTGRWCHETSATWDTPLDATHPTLAEILRGRGYATAGFVANTFYCAYEMGLGRGFIRFEDYGVSPAELVVSSSIGRLVAHSPRVRRWVGRHDVLTHKPAPQLRADFLRWLSAQDSARPFFAFLNYFDAHEPYIPPEEFRIRFETRTVRLDGRIEHQSRRGLISDRHKLSADEIAAEIDGYDAAIAYLDHELDLLLGELERRGVLQHTVVLITADHGEQFGEHNLHVHGNSLYDPLLHVPLIVLMPGKVPAGARVPAPVTLRDLGATVLELTGAAQARPDFPGRSLSRHWNPGGASDPTGPTDSLEMILAEVRKAQWGQPWYPSCRGNMRSIHAGTLHYIDDGNGGEQLYDVAKDPGETQDLVSRGDAGPQLKRFRDFLKQLPPQPAE